MKRKIKMDLDKSKDLGDWDYRLVLTEYKWCNTQSEKIIDIREVYYFTDGSIAFWSEEPANLTIYKPDDLDFYIQVLSELQNNTVLRKTEDGLVDTHLLLKDLEDDLSGYDT